MASELPPWYHDLLRWLRRHGDSKQDAEDHLHDAYVRLVEFEQNCKVQEPEAFMRTVARHVLIDDRRGRSARGEVIELDERVVASASPSVEQWLIDRELLTQVAGVLMDEDEQTWAIVIDSMLYGMTQPEIAKKHRVSLSTVERRIAKAVFMIAKWRKAHKL